jgi:hypothetical protein
MAGKNAVYAGGSSPTRNFASGNIPVSGNLSGGGMSRVTHANAPGPAQMRSSVVPRQSFSSAPGAYAGAPRPNFASAPRASYASAPRPSFASAPRASFASAPRASFASAPRASFASAPRMSIASAPRASFSGAARASFSGAGSRGGGGRYR